MDIGTLDGEKDEVLAEGALAFERIGASRYGIAEWYGRDVCTMTADQRRAAAAVATGLDKNLPACPFMAALTPGAKCNKRGGVCTIRRYEPSQRGEILPTANCRVVTTCPARFLGADAVGTPVFEWVAAKMLGAEKAVLIKETPFLRKLENNIGSPRVRKSAELQLELAMSQQVHAEQSDSTLPDEAKKAGRIDWLLLDTLTEKDKDPRWCALETQAVYFSGDKMGLEFEAYLARPDSIIFPLGFRRPDYRSSGPKRLAPQLSVKVPVLRGWGKKVAVLVDRYFFDSMYELPEADIHGRTDQEKRDNSEVAWFVVDYDSEMRLILHKYKFSTLVGSIDALNATAPMSKEAFNTSLRALASDRKKLGKKVFRP